VKFKTAAIAMVALGALAAGTGTANADTSTSGYASKDGIQLSVRPISPWGTVATWCNDRSTGVRIYAEIKDQSTGRDLPMEDIHSGWTTYPTYINFSPGGCESFALYNASVNGHYLTVYADYWTDELGWLEGQYLAVPVKASVPG